MKIFFFVHDCFLEIGHSNAMIETLRTIPKEKIKELHIVAFTCGDLNKLFPDLKGKLYFHQVPFPKLYPFIFKMFFYHLWSYFFVKFCIPKNAKKIGIGIACLFVDLVNIQFIHAQWKSYYFKIRKRSFINYIYKKILFKYFGIAESYLYTKRDLRISALSSFVAEYCKRAYYIVNERIDTIYSSVNLESYRPLDSSRVDQYKDLLKRYPMLSNIDYNRPIFLFVGAHERKGLDFALKSLLKLDNSQIIIVGKSESGIPAQVPIKISYAEIPFTNEIVKFYSLCDIFLFPTHYEPFGLVITEAAASGMIVYVTKRDVGASEILGNLKGIFIMDTPSEFEIEEYKILSHDERMNFRDERAERFKEFSWQKAGEKFLKLMEKDIG